MSTQITFYNIARLRILHPTKRFLSSNPTSRPSPGATAKPLSPHIGFYKSFGRPIAKVFFSAIVAYQVIYWAWVKLEAEEIKEQKATEMASLEAKLRALSSNHKTP